MSTKTREQIIAQLERMLDKHDRVAKAQRDKRNAEFSAWIREWTERNPHLVDPGHIELTA
jgi:hypothetical protein